MTARISPTRVEDRRSRWHALCALEIRHQGRRIAVAGRVPLWPKQVILVLHDDGCLASAADVQMGERHRIPERFAPALIRLGVLAVALDFPGTVVNHVVV